VVAVLASVLVASCAERSPEATLAEARQNFASGDYRAAAIFLQNVLEADANNAAAHALWGRIALAVGDLTQARERLLHARTLGAPAEDVAIPLAMTLMEMDQAPAALEELESLPSESRGADYWLARGRALTITGAYEDAERSFAASAGLSGSTAPLFVERARLAAVRGDLTGADALVDQALALDSMNAEAQALRGMLATSGNRLEQAEVSLQSAANIYESRFQTALAAPVLLRLVQVQLALNEIDAATNTATRISRVMPSSAFADYANGLVAFQRGDFDETVRLLRAALSKEPEQAQFMALLGAAHLAIGNFGQAEQQFQSILARNPADPAATRLLAETRIRQQRPRIALETLQGLDSSITDQDLGLLVLQSTAHLQNEDFAGAIPFLEQALALDPNNQAVVLGLVQAYTKTGRTSDADTVLRSSSALTVDQEYAANVSVLVARWQEEGVAAASAYVDELIAATPSDPRAHALAAIFHRLENDGDAAMSSLERAIELDAGFVPAHLALAGMLAERGRVDEAERSFLEVARLDGRNLVALLSLSQLAVQKGDSAAAEAYAARAAEGNPDSVLPKLALARIYLGNRDPERAAEQLALAEDLSPRHPDVLVTKSLLALARGAPAEAVSALRDVATQLPDRPGVALLLAEAYVAAEDPDGARQSLAAAVERMPTVPEIRAALGAADLRLGNRVAALRVAKDLQVEFPQRAEGFALEGLARMVERGYGDAAAMYELAYQRAKTWDLLASAISALRLAGDAGRGETLVRDWLETAPNDANARLVLAELLQSAGRAEAALTEYVRVIEGDPDNVAALNNAAWFAHERKDPRALPYAERAAQLAPDNAAVLDTLGWILTQQGRARDALGHLTKAAQLTPDALEIRYHLAVAQVDVGQREAARQTLAALLAAEGPFEQRDAARQLLGSL
jgi:putative PEP-CTERM system TPR-repeat lipoprotein